MPLSCVPDEYLTQGHLDVIYNEFAASLRAGDSEATVLAAVVNNVRSVYMAALLRARNEELERLRRQLDPLPGYSPGPTDPPSAAAEPPTASTAVIPAPPITWPAKTFTLHIGSYSVDQRRDMPGWVGMNRDGWTERTSFQVFKYQEPGTMRVDVIEQHDSHRVLVNRSQERWTHRLTFYVFPKHRIGTEYVWVAYRADPERCLFLKGGEEGLEGWEKVLEFWAPV